MLVVTKEMKLLIAKFYPYNFVYQIGSLYYCQFRNQVLNSLNEKDEAVFFDLKNRKIDAPDRRTHAYTMQVRDDSKITQTKDLRTNGKKYYLFITEIKYHPIVNQCYLPPA